MAVTVSYLQTPPVVALAANPVNILVGSSIAGKTNLFIHLEIGTYDGADFTSLGFEDSIPVKDGVAMFDISDYFNKLLTPVFTYPEHYTNVIVPQASMSVKYRVRTWETYIDTDGSLVDKKETDPLMSDSDYFVVPGAVSEDDQAVINTLSTTWWDEWVTQKKFQHWMPGDKSTSLKSVEKLYWIARRSATETLSINWTATDNSTGTISISYAMTAYMMYEICISPALIEQLSGKDLASYTVSIADQSETLTYNIDRSYFERQEYFLFTNGFGCYESLWCHGYRQGEIEFDRLQFGRSLSANFTHTDRKMGSTRATTIRNRKSNTGYLNNVDWYNWALSLLSGDDGWIYTDNSIVPVVITSDKLGYIDDLSDLWSLEFEWKHSREGRFGGSLGLALEFILPPYFSKVAAFFNRYIGSNLTDMIAGLKATVSGSDITWPEIIGSDVLDFSDATFWDNSGLAWYSAGTPRKCPLSFMVGGTWAPAATASIHARLFHKDYSSKVRDILPVIVYKSNLTADEQAVVVDWLDWYFVLVQNGAVLKQGTSTIIQ